MSSDKIIEMFLAAKTCNKSVEHRKSKRRNRITNGAQKFVALSGRRRPKHVCSTILLFYV